ncbi:hypothetical protein GLW04_17685 [Halobacillus litoralis]|uniref:Uncharacterized protein n=1 Tax=Halobacillus litoralis TaxID=45668 RepID=A0A845E7T6_9BACI|nr:MULTISPECIES: hypothetical protein [Halobacillus]MCA1023899.1 hypothetical protein [Halobacillus litoralis]MYL21734.1 hypothetical protein [Halobacillus litoralis]MYL31696.1 hypothetical protein [Halobacillus halophilus]MYL39943.1 hypothetical protein [Halobacillus litoralis]
MDFNNNAFYFLAALLAGYALFSLGDTGGNFFDQFLYYAGYIAMILFSFVLIFTGLARFLKQYQ